MTSDILHNPTFPHGTPDGFRRGCRGSHCPAALACRDVHRRYVGDFRFARMLDDGMPLEQIIAHDLEAARAARRAEREALQAKTRPKRVKAAKKPSAGRTRRPFKTDGTPGTPLRHDIVKWHTAGLTDLQIAEKVGKTRDQVRASRRWLNLPPNRAATTIDRLRELHAQGMTDIEMGQALGKNAGYIGMIRRRANLPVNKHPRWKCDPDEFRAQHATGKTDRQLAEHFGVDPHTAAKRRRRLGLTLNPSPAKAGLSASQETP